MNKQIVARAQRRISKCHGATTSNVDLRFMNASLLRVFVTVHREVLVSEAEAGKAMTTFLGVVIANSNWIEETVCGLFGSYRRGPRRYAEKWLSTATRKWLLTLGTLQL
jgi:hypothetical protein